MNTPTLSPNRGSVILCGGESTRMGQPKALLPFGGQTMLERVVSCVTRVVPAECIVVAAAADQQLPPLPAEITLARDERPGLGPLEGLRAGLAALPAEVAAAFVTSCDAPLLVPAFLEHMFDLLGEHEIAVPREGQFTHPLAAIYRPSILPAIERLLATDRRSLQSLLAECRTREVAVEELRKVDPQLNSLLNVNSPELYAAALARARLQ